MLDDASRVPGAGRVAEEERVAAKREGPERGGADQLVRAALGPDTGATEARRAVVVFGRAEEDAPRAAEVHELRDLELAQLAGLGQRRPGLPRLEVLRPRVADHAAPVRRAVVRARAHEHVKASRGGVAEDPRVAPVLRRDAGPELLVPARVRLDERRPP